MKKIKKRCRIQEAALQATWYKSIKTRHLTMSRKNHSRQKELELWCYLKMKWVKVLLLKVGPQQTKMNWTYRLSLYQYILIKLKKTRNERETNGLILSGLKYLALDKKIIHYDLKPQNIIFHEGEIKISDFLLNK